MERMTSLKYLHRYIMPALVIALPAITLAQSTNSFQSLANTIAKILNAGALLLITGAIAVFFYNIVGDVIRMQQGHDVGADLRKTVMVGIGIIFVMVSIWGIIQLLQNSLFGGPGPAASNGAIIFNQ